MQTSIIARFTILGEPNGKGRHRTTKTGRAYTPAKTTNYEAEVRAAFGRAKPYWIPVEGPVFAQITAFIQAPKSMKKALTPLVENETLCCMKKPDWDNIGKIVCDALNGVAYRDDSQVVDAHVKKFWSYRPRVEILLATPTPENDPSGSAHLDNRQSNIFIPHVR